MNKIKDQIPVKYGYIKLISDTQNSKVVLVEEKSSKNRLILKLFYPDSPFYKGIFEEYVFIKEIQHPNLISILDTGVTGNDIFYYILPYYEKDDPIVLCKKHGKQVFLDIIWQCLKGLSFLHNRNKLHGDISLDNIIIHKTGGKPDVKISDFGLSSLIVANKITDISGTAYFLAPELITDTSKPQMTVQSDLYAFGKYLEILLTGKMDTFENPWEMLKKRITVNKLKINPLFDIEDEIVSVVCKLIEIDPKNRYSSIQEVVKDIYPFLIKDEVDISYNRFMETEVKINLYRKSIIDRIVSKVDDNKFICVNGDETNAFHETINYLKAKLNFSKRKVIEITNSMFFNDFSSNLLQNFAKTEKLSDILHKEIVFFINKKLFSKNLTEILAIGTENESLKFVIINNSYLHDDTISAIKIRNYNIQKLSKNEFDRYLALVFGNEKFPAVFRDYIFSNAYYNLELINEFIQIAQIQGAILQKNLKWEFHPEKLQTDFLSKKIKSKYLSKLNSLNKETFHFLVQISFWHQEFSIKEISDIFHISYSDVFEYTKIAEKAGILTPHSRKIRFRYNFVRQYLKSKIESKIKYQIRENIISFLGKQDKLKFEQKRFLLLNLKENKNYKKILLLCKIYFDDYQDQLKNLIIIGEFVFQIRFDLIKINVCEVMKILLMYSKIILPSKNRIEAKKIYEFLNNIRDKCVNNLIMNNLLVLEFQIYMLDREYTKVISIFLKQKNKIEKFHTDSYIDILLSVSGSYYFIGEIPNAIKISEKLLKCCDSNDAFKVKKGSILSSLAFLYYRSNNLKQSEKYYVEAIELYKKMDDSNKLGHLYSRLASLKSAQFELDKSEKYYKLAKKYLEKGKVFALMPLVLHGFGYLSIEKGEFWSALTLYKKANDMEKKRGLLVATFPISESLLGLGYYKQALFFAKKSLNTIKSNNKKFLISNHLALIFKLYVNLGYIEKAEQAFKEIEKKEGINEIRIRSTAHYYRAIFFSNENSLDKMWNEINIICSNLNVKKSIVTSILVYHLKMKYFYLFDNLIESMKYKKLEVEKLKTINDRIIEAPDIYYDAYLITKRAFKENLTTENYKKYLHKAFQMIIDRKNNLPTNPMRRTYLGQKNVKKIVDKYEEEMKRTKFNKSETLLLEFLEEISQIITEVTDEKRLFNKILEIAISVTGADRGLILTLSHDTNELKVRHSYQVENDSIEDVTTVSKKIIKEVFSKRKAVYNTKVSSNKEFDPYQSFVNLKIESVICLPLIIHKQILGSVYLDSRSLLAFSPDEIKFLNIFAQITSSSIETSRYYCRMEEEKRSMEKFLAVERRGHKNIIATSPQMMEILKKVEQIAPTDVNVLIEGESGTGKELIAKDIHRLSKRNNKLFIPIDCGSLSENIIESELFGHIKGAFTGAVSDKKGLFEEANGGTVFLDEISNISLNMQTKLLRLIQEGEFKRVGENKVRRTNVRLITASNIPLKKLVIEAKFRQDLYYRLSIFPIELPVLRERKGDIALLAKHFLNYFNSIHHKNIIGFEENALRILEKYKWDGNVRQLQNEIERAVIICEKKRLTEKELRHLGESTFPQDIIIPQTSDTFNEQVNNFKLTLIKNTLEKCDNNWTKTAEKLGISRQNLRQIYKRMKEK